jgi:hypothetical protein
MGSETGNDGLQSVASQVKSLERRIARIEENLRLAHIAAVPPPEKIVEPDASRGWVRTGSRR